ncbi:MAG TPA: ATP-binding protein, partial [Blastocatellia bacterium]|nr:ATP-binding protein [Blastocatellia bacterium]
GFRMVFWYSSIFILSGSLLFALMYFLLSSSFSRSTREDIHLKLKECAAQYESGGLEALKREVILENQSGKAFFVRLVGANGATEFVEDPFQWVDQALGGSYVGGRDGTDRWIRAAAPDGEHAIDIDSAMLPDGSIIQVGKSSREEKALLKRFREVFVYIMFPLVVVGIVGGAIVAYRALHPLRSLVQTIRSISTGRMDARVPSSQTGDELDDLAVLFNSMLSKIESLIEAMRGSLDNVAHDLRTPLARLRGTAELALSSDAKTEDYRESLADCIEEADRILSLLNTLMDISEAETGAMKLAVEPVEVGALIEDTVELYTYAAEEKGVTLSAACTGAFFLAVDRSRMRQVLANLADNALKYTASGGRIEIEAVREEQHAVITVRDNGSGIPEEELPRIWDRLYRGDKSRSQRGLGLGLNLVRAIVHAHDGRIEALSAPGKGSTFSIYLPTTKSVGARNETEAEVTGG